MKAEVVGVIRFDSNEDLKDAVTYLRDSAHMNSDKKFITDEGVVADPDGVDVTEGSIYVPLGLYKNLHGALEEVCKKSSSHRIVCTSDDGTFEGWTVNNNQTNDWDLYDWAEQNNLALVPKDRDGDEFFEWQEGVMEHFRDEQKDLLEMYEDFKCTVCVTCGDSITKEDDMGSTTGDDTMCYICDDKFQKEMARA